MISLILARPREGDKKPELAVLKPSALKKRARAAGASKAEIEEADDADDAKAAMMALVLAHETCEAQPSLREELEGLKPSELKKRARVAGAKEAEIEDADDAENSRTAVIDLIIAAQ